MASYEEKMKLCDMLKELAEHHDDSLNLDIASALGPEDIKKGTALLQKICNQSSKIYGISHEDTEQGLRNELAESNDPPRPPRTREFDEMIVIKNATFNARKHLKNLKATERNYDCSNVRLSRTENMAPDLKMYGKKVRRKFQGQRQIAMEVKSYGMLAKECSYEDFLDTEKTFIILSGVAGSGKSVVLREIAFEFYQIKEFCVGDLCKYKLLVHYECRNETVTNYQQLIQFNFPGVCGHLGVEFVANIIAKLSVLYVVDGYDEVSPASELVLKHILECVLANDKSTKSSVLFGSRPHSVQSLKDFLKSHKITDNEIDRISLMY